MLSKVRTVSVCCEGYTRSLNGTSCTPVCGTRCVHGQCTAPNMCSCNDGYGGSDCSKCKYLTLLYFFHVKALKDLLFASNQVTQYFFLLGLSPFVN